LIVTDASRVGPWVCRHAGGTWVEGRGTAIGLDKHGILHAGVLYEDWNGANIICHIAGIGRWACKEYLRVIFDYPFRQLEAKRITVPVASVNKKARKFVEHLGFELEATLQGAHPQGDLLIYKMTPDKCRWLNLKERHGKS
jgi:hypothetical protein